MKITAGMGIRFQEYLDFHNIKLAILFLEANGGYKEEGCKLAIKMHRQYCGLIAG